MTLTLAVASTEHNILFSKYKYYTFIRISYMRKVSKVRYIILGSEFIGGVYK